MLIRREERADHDAVHRVHLAAFPTPLESDLLDALRADPGWLPRLSLLAEIDNVVVGHVVATRAWLETTPPESAPPESAPLDSAPWESAPWESAPALGIGPLGVLPERQRDGVGSALMHAVIAAAEALDETLLGLLGEPVFYRRFGFQAAGELGVLSPDPTWAGYFQARRLLGRAPTGTFRYAAAFNIPA
jgi:predicted N-acetyltransferase YhbS